MTVVTTLNDRYVHFMVAVSRDDLLSIKVGNTELLRDVADELEAKIRSEADDA